MAMIKANFRLSCVVNNRESVSWFNLWGRAYISYRLVSKRGFDYVELVRTRDGVVLFHDGEKPSWLI